MHAPSSAAEKLDIYILDAKCPFRLVFYLQQFLVHLSKNSSKFEQTSETLLNNYKVRLCRSPPAPVSMVTDQRWAYTRSSEEPGLEPDKFLKMILGWVKSSKLGETETFPLIVKLCLEMSNKIISNISNPGLCLKYNLVKECPHISHRVTLNIIKQNKSNFEKRNIAIIKKILSAISYTV